MLQNIDVATYRCDNLEAMSVRYYFGCSKVNLNVGLPVSWYNHSIHTKLRHISTTVINYLKIGKTENHDMKIRRVIFFKHLHLK